MHLILTGATGLVGSAVLHHILSLPPTSKLAQEITRVSILSRKPQIPLLNHPSRPQTNTHTEIQVIPHSDFTTYDAGLMQQLNIPPTEKVGIVWALGVSTQTVKDETRYDEITRIYALNAAKAFASLRHEAAADAPDAATRQVNFVYVSGEGATQSPSFMSPMFARVKGRAETQLIDLMGQSEYAALKVYSVRPAAVDWGTQTALEADAKERDWRQGFIFKATEKVLIPLIRRGVFGKGVHSPTEEIGKTLTKLAVGDGQALAGEGIVGGGGRIVSNVGLRRLAATGDGDEMA